MAELAVLAHIYLVFADIPQILESRFVDGLFQCGVLDIAVAFAHCRAVLDIASASIHILRFRQVLWHWDSMKKG
jgi:hypothetical protein